MRQRFPFSPNPIGWFAIAYSDELADGGVVPLSYFGSALVLFRTADGSAHVLDAHCPHRGAHFGHGGVVEGDCIRCPFHGWSFSGGGECTEIPYAGTIPPAARVRAWPVCERNGFVFIYYHPLHDQPGWEVPILPEYGTDDWTPYARRRWRIRTNIHEMVENAFDSAHFRTLHGLHRIPEPALSFHGPHFRLHSHTLMDTPGGALEGTLDIDSRGFGFGTARFMGLIETLLVTAITPIDDQYVDARFSFTVKRLPDEGATQFVGEGFIAELTRQVEQDIPVWEHKTYLAQPALCEGDTLIATFRRWARQFYP